MPVSVCSSHQPYILNADRKEWKDELVDVRLRRMITRVTPICLSRLLVHPHVVHKQVYREDEFREVDRSEVLGYTEIGNDILRAAIRPQCDDDI